MPVPLRLVDPEPGPAGVYTVELAAHCGRLAAAVRCLLETHPSQREVPETLARVALDLFDQWQESSTGGVRQVGVTGADAPRREQLR